MFNLIGLYDSAWTAKNIDDVWNHYDYFARFKEKNKNSDNIIVILKIESNWNDYITDFALLVVPKIEYENVIDKKKMLIAYLKSVPEYKDYWRLRDDGLKLTIIKKTYIRLLREKEN